MALRAQFWLNGERQGAGSSAVSWLHGFNARDMEIVDMKTGKARIYVSSAGTALFLPLTHST